jgi:hypothetical protein
MRCRVCGKTIRAREPRSYVTIKRRKVYGCAECQEAFDRWIDGTCPACGSEEFCERRSDGFVWNECDACGHKTDAEKALFPP